MNLNALFELFERASEAIGHQDFVVIGSLSILGLEESFSIPEDMCMSIDVDCYTKSDPPRIYELQAILGENSAFHRSHHYYLNPVSPRLPTLPDDWQNRLLKVEKAKLRIWCLEPNDAAIAKYARGEPRDQRWIRAGIFSGVLSLALIKSRLKTTSFLDTKEESIARSQIDADFDWFESIKNTRPKA